MAWDDFLQDLSGGVSGFVKGIDAGMAPLSTWEGIRTKDLANDRYEIGNEDVDYTQRARMGEEVPDFYGQQVGAQISGFGKTRATNERDIYGVEQQLSLVQSLTDPQGEFQLAMAERGLTPDMPEYRTALAAAISRYDPTGAVTAVDKYGIDALRDRGAQDQASLAYLQDFVRTNSGDPEAIVTRGADGKLYIESKGEKHEVTDPKALIKAADMLSGAGGPQGAIDRGIKQMLDIQKTNAQMYKDYNNGATNDKQLIQSLTQERVGYDKQISELGKRYDAIIKSDAYKDPGLSQEARDAMTLDVRTEAARARRNQDDVMRRLQQVSSGRRIPTSAPNGGGAFIMNNPITGMPMLGSPGYPSGPVANGGTTVTTKNAGFDPLNASLGVSPTDAYGPGSGWGDDTMQGAGDDSYGMGAPPPAAAVPRKSAMPKNMPGGGGDFDLMNLVPASVRGAMAGTTGGPGTRYPRQGVPNSSAASRMSPEQMFAFLQLVAPNIAPQGQAGRGSQYGPDPRMLAYMRSIGVI